MAPVIGAEIGVFRGNLSYQLLSLMPNLTLYMVDRWCPYREGEWIRRGYIAGGTHEVFEKWEAETREKVKGFGNRAIIIKSESLVAADKFPLDFFDFVFIDAIHVGNYVAMDINSWGPRVKPGGLICGHDYNPLRYPGLIEVVNKKFPESLEIDVDFTWFHRKPV